MPTPKTPKAQEIEVAVVPKEDLEAFLSAAGNFIPYNQLQVFLQKVKIEKRG